MKNILNIIENILFPQFCEQCESSLLKHNSIMCDTCLSKLQPTELNNWVKDLTTHEYLDFAYSIFWFDEILQKSIHHVKYNNYEKIISILIQIAEFQITQVFNEINPDILVPIPLYHVKYRERGFNQAERIAKPISKLSHISIDTKIIKRVKWTNSQTKLNIEERNMNTGNAFKSKTNIDNKRILLIDDILTTGSTANSCAKVLKSNGAKWVGILTIGTPIVKK
jgi:competence protein ComFC